MYKDFNFCCAKSYECLIRNFGKFEKNRVKINDDICATAKGYEFMVKHMLRSNGGK
jgi:plasmid segregation protein ParM